MQGTPTFSRPHKYETGGDARTSKHGTIQQDITRRETASICAAMARMCQGGLIQLHSCWASPVHLDKRYSKFVVPLAASDTPALAVENFPACHCVEAMVSIKWRGGQRISRNAEAKRGKELPGSGAYRHGVDPDKPT